MSSSNFRSGSPNPKPRLRGLTLAQATRIVCVSLASLLVLQAAVEGAQRRRKKERETQMSGKVMNQQGEPLTGATVNLTSAAGVLAQATTDGEGEFRIPLGDAAGEYQVRITADGYAPFEEGFSFLRGEQQNIEFRLVDAATGRRNQAVTEYNAGAAAFNAGDREEAEARFLQAVEHDPDLPPPHLALADIYLTDEEFEKAARHAEKFLSHEPANQQAQILAYLAHRNLGDNQARVVELRQLLAADPELASKLAVQVFNEGALASQGGNMDEAIEKFQAALELDPKLTQAYSGLASMYYNRSAYDDALRAVEALLALEPTSVDGRRYRYLVHDARNDAAAAAEAMEAYLEVDRKGAVDVLYRRADLDFRAGELEPATEALVKILEIEPEMPRAHYTLGLCYATSDPAKARFHLQRFIELAPDDPEAQSAREMLGHL